MPGATVASNGNSFLFCNNRFMMYHTGMDGFTESDGGLCPRHTQSEPERNMGVNAGTCNPKIGLPLLVRFYNYVESKIIHG